MSDSTGNGVKLLGEVVLPGASQFIDGNIKVGALHLIAAAAATALIAGPGGLLVAALVRGNSFTTSTVKKPLHKAVFEGDEKAAATS